MYTFEELAVAKYKLGGQIPSYQLGRVLKLVKAGKNSRLVKLARVNLRKLDRALFGTRTTAPDHAVILNPTPEAGNIISATSQAEEQAEQITLLQQKLAEQEAILAELNERATRALEGRSNNTSAGSTTTTSTETGASTTNTNTRTNSNASSSSTASTETTDKNGWWDKHKPTVPGVLKKTGKTAFWTAAGWTLLPPGAGLAGDLIANGTRLAIGDDGYNWNLTKKGMEYSLANRLMELQDGQTKKKTETKKEEEAVSDIKLPEREVATAQETVGDTATAQPRINNTGSNTTLNYFKNNRK